MIMIGKVGIESDVILVFNGYFLLFDNLNGGIGLGELFFGFFVFMSVVYSVFIVGFIEGDWDI